MIFKAFSKKEPITMIGDKKRDLMRNMRAEQVEKIMDVLYGKIMEFENVPFSEQRNAELPELVKAYKELGEITWFSI